MIEKALITSQDVVERIDDGWWEARMTIPAHTFYTWVYQPPACDRFLMVSSRDVYDRQYAIGLLTFAASHLDRLPTDRPLSKVTGFAHAGYAHDTVCAINADVHRYFGSDLDSRLLVIFPVYDCEFSGDEDVTTAIAQRRLADPIDWRHELQPKASAAFLKRRPQGRYKGPEPVLYPVYGLFTNLWVLTQDRPKKLARLVNFRGASCMIEGTADGYEATLDDGSRPLVNASWHATKAWVWAFLAPGRALRNDLVRMTE